MTTATRKAIEHPGMMARTLLSLTSHAQHRSQSPMISHADEHRELLQSSNSWGSKL